MTQVWLDNMVLQINYHLLILPDVNLFLIFYVLHLFLHLWSDLLYPTETEN